MTDTQYLLNYVSEIEDIVNIFSSIKPVESWLVDKNILYVSLQEELYLFEKAILQEKFMNLTGVSSKDFYSIDPDDEKTFLIKL